MSQQAADIKAVAPVLPNSRPAEIKGSEAGLTLTTRLAVAMILLVAAAVFAVGWLNLVKAGYSGVLPSLISEQFPVETRAVGVAFSYSISVTVFGGFAPFVATWLIAQTGDVLSPAYYLMFTAVLSIAALMAIQRRPVQALAEA